MFQMDRWDVALLALVGYLAVIVLVRLMAKSRDQILVQLEEQVALERERQATEAKKQAREEKKQRMAA